MSDLSPTHAAYLAQLAASEDLVEARRRCEQFLQMTAAESRPIGEPKTPEDLILSLLSGGKLPETNQRFGRLTGRVYTTFTVAVLSSDAGNSDYALPMQYLSKLPDTWCVLYQGRLVCVSAAASGTADVSALTGAVRKYGLSGGVGRPCGALLELREAYKQAAATLRTIRVLQRSCTLSFYDDYLMIRLLDQIPGHAELDAFCLPDIQALQAYDAAHDSELCRTLLCYLEHAKNVSNTARELNIHRNTVHYRINKCREVMPGLDFGNDYITFLLMLSLHIAEYDYYRKMLERTQTFF